jgi:branched-chain amino acid aminotransferase
VEPLAFDDRDGFIWVDGRMSPWREAKLHVLSHSLHYGNACFEGERAYGGKVFKLREHSARLIDSCRVMDFELPYKVEQIDKATQEVVEANRIKEGYVRPIAWRGPSQLSVSAVGTTPHLAIAAWPWPAYYGDAARMKGIRLMTSSWVRPSPNSAPTNTKAAGMYMICTLSRHAADNAGFDDALMLDYRGRVAEATGANIFFVFGGVLHTPAPECILAGITRQTVMDLARARGLEVVERPIMPEEMSGASEVFLTGTAIEVIPIRQIDRLDFKVGPIATSLAKEYQDLVRRSV